MEEYISGLAKEKVNKLQEGVSKKVKEIFAHLSQKTDFYQKDTKHTQIALLCIKMTLEQNQKNSELYQKTTPLLKTLITEETFCSFTELIHDIFRLYFTLYSNAMNYKDGYNFCKEFINLLPRTKYSNIKGFFLFFSYQLKTFSEIDEVMRTNLIETNYTSQIESNDFCLFAFYKGLIHLIYEEYVMASFSFMMCVLPFTKHLPTVIDYLQIESFKRLCFLLHIVDDEFKPMIFNILKYLEILKQSPKLAPFFELIDLTRNPYMKLETYIISKKTFLRSNNLYGIAKKTLWECRFKALAEVLRKYKRIRLTKLSDMVNMKKQNVVKVLEMNVANNRINVRYNEVEDIIDVVKVANNFGVAEMKKYYQYLVSACQDLFTYDMTKINEERKIAAMKPEEIEELARREKDMRIEDDMEIDAGMMEDEI